MVRCSSVAIARVRVKSRLFVMGMEGFGGCRWRRADLLMASGKGTDVEETQVGKCDVDDAERSFKGGQLGGSEGKQGIFERKL